MKIEFQFQCSMYPFSLSVESLGHWRDDDRLIGIDDEKGGKYSVKVLGKVVATFNSNEFKSHGKDHYYHFAITADEFISNKPVKITLDDRSYNNSSFHQNINLNSDRTEIYRRILCRS